MKFTTTWKSSKKPSRQRKYRANAPLHIKYNFVNAHLSKDLRTKYKKRSLAVRKGDNVKIMRGQFKNKQGKVERVSLKKTIVYINGIEVTKRDGTKALFPVDPSNLLVTELNMDDKIRQKVIERK